MTLDLARRAVFGTNELLENLLSYLPSRELFVLQGVCKSWRAVIAASPGLQERMFLRLQNATSEETWVLDGPNRSGPVGNIAAYRKSVELTGVPKFRLFDSDRTTGAEFLIPLTLNPIFNLIDTIHNLTQFPFSTASRLAGSA